MGMTKINWSKIHSGYVWLSESTKKRKEKTKENGFLIFGFTIENTKENLI